MSVYAIDQRDLESNGIHLPCGVRPFSGIPARERVHWAPYNFTDCLNLFWGFLSYSWVADGDAIFALCGHPTFISAAIDHLRQFGNVRPLVPDN
jgi:hypothetical protein